MSDLITAAQKINEFRSVMLVKLELAYCNRHYDNDSYMYYSGVIDALESAERLVKKLETNPTV